MTYEKVYVLDTNVILEDASQIITIGQYGKNLIVIPETAIDEMDAKKSGFDEINFQAREFGRLLSDAKYIGTKHPNENVTIMSMEVQDVVVDIVSFKDYDLHGVVKSIINDRKIIKVAQFAKEYYDNPETKFLSNDVMCRTRAVSLGVPSQAVYRNNKDKKPEYIKHIHIGDSSGNSTPSMRIEDIDTDWAPENYCYHVTTNAGERIGYVVKGEMRYISDNDFNGLSVKPLNLGQRFAVSGMIDEDINVCIIEALAGSGKTLLALSAGIKMIKDGVYDKIVYIRNSIESVDKAEDVGFLPGLEEKFKIYNFPLFDTLEFIAQKELKKAGNTGNKDAITSKINEISKRYNIETMWPGSIRGRTISNAFVIVDEVQNFSKKSLQTVLSRLDEECKVVCIGSNRQIDHPYVNKYTNGLSTLVEASKSNDHAVTLFGTELNKVVRGKITEWTEKIFEK